MSWQVNYFRSEELESGSEGKQEQRYTLVFSRMCCDETEGLTCPLPYTYKTHPIVRTVDEHSSVDNGLQTYNTEFFILTRFCVLVEFGFLIQFKSLSRFGFEVVERNSHILWRRSLRERTVSANSLGRLIVVRNAVGRKGVRHQVLGRGGSEQVASVFVRVDPGQQFIFNFPDRTAPNLTLQ